MSNVKVLLMLLNQLRTSPNSSFLHSFYCLRPCWGLSVKVPVKSLLMVLRAAPPPSNNLTVFDCQDMFVLTGIKQQEQSLRSA